MNLQLTDLLLLSALCIAAALFWRAQKIRESALLATRRYCQREDVSLLDETVALRRVRIRRDPGQGWCLLRCYSFEFTVTGGERYQGEIRMLGPRVLSITLPPHRFSPENERLH
ncbi:DUF3301 domain-containing protein [Alcanivorax sp. 24]|uniref:DUF3301 domain-containing protein n=1 Tax=Alcanivorax sp. 24 TaxID=2545266 RepID=UPI00105C1F16|nr:DUF3301 domain-containing protein [Alcanivorax sp. 24]